VSKGEKIQADISMRGSHWEAHSDCSRWQELFWPDYLARTGAAVR